MIFVSKVVSSPLARRGAVKLLSSPRAHVFAAERSSPQRIGGYNACSSSKQQNGFAPRRVGWCRRGFWCKAPVEWGLTPRRTPTDPNTLTHDPTSLFTGGDPISDIYRLYRTSSGTRKRDGLLRAESGLRDGLNLISNPRVKRPCRRNGFDKRIHSRD